MNKIEQIKAEIERELSAHDKVDHLEAYEVGKAWSRGHRQALEGILSFLDSLPDEKPSEDLDFQVFAKEMDAVFNLPKEVTENTEEAPLNWEYAIARHFANWQKAQMEKQAAAALAKDGITTADLVAYNKGVAEGRRMEKEEMMQKAVKEVVWDASEDIEPCLVVDVGKFNVKQTDEVKIIIVKED